MAMSCKSALFVVLGEAFSPQHKSLILERCLKGIQSWDDEAAGCSISATLSDLVAENPPIENTLNDDEKLVRYSSQGIEIFLLINPLLTTLTDQLKIFFSLNLDYYHVLSACHVMQYSGSWIVQDNLFSVSSFLSVLRDFKMEHATLSLNVTAEGDWNEAFLVKNCPAEKLSIKVNPECKKDVVEKSVSDVVNYISTIVSSNLPREVLPSTDVVGDIKFVRPTLYVFPSHQGDSALFGVRGFNLLVNGGFGRKSSFWSFVRHIDKIDVLLLTHLGADNILGIRSFVEKKVHENVHPDIGHVFFNAVTGSKTTAKNEELRESSLVVNLAEEGSKVVEGLQRLGHVPHPCVSSLSGNSIQSVNLYHVIGHGSLDIYVLNPSGDSKELKDFLGQWSKQAENFSSTAKSGKGSNLPLVLPDAASVCALLVWTPEDKAENITRILFPGNTPQKKILEGLERINVATDIFKQSMCSESSLQVKSKKQNTMSHPSQKAVPKAAVAVKSTAVPTTAKIETQKSAKTKVKRDETSKDVVPKTTPVKTNGSATGPKTLSSNKKVVLLAEKPVEHVAGAVPVQRTKETSKVVEGYSVAAMNEVGTSAPLPDVPVSEDQLTAALVAAKPISVGLDFPSESVEMHLRASSPMNDLPVVIEDNAVAGSPIVCKEQVDTSTHDTSHEANSVLLLSADELLSSSASYDESSKIPFTLGNDDSIVGNISQRDEFSRGEDRTIERGEIITEPGVQGESECSKTPYTKEELANLGIYDDDDDNDIVGESALNSDLQMGVAVGLGAMMEGGADTLPMVSDIDPQVTVENEGCMKTDEPILEASLPCLKDVNVDTVEEGTNEKLEDYPIVIRDNLQTEDRSLNTINPAFPSHDQMADTVFSANELIHGQGESSSGLHDPQLNDVENNISSENNYVQEKHQDFFEQGELEAIVNQQINQIQGGAALDFYDQQTVAGEDFSNQPFNQEISQKVEEFSHEDNSCDHQLMQQQKLEDGQSNDQGPFSDQMLYNKENFRNLQEDQISDQDKSPDQQPLDQDLNDSLIDQENLEAHFAAYDIGFNEEGQANENTLFSSGNLEVENTDNRLVCDAQAQGLYEQFDDEQKYVHDEATQQENLGYQDQPVSLASADLQEAQPYDGFGLPEAISHSDHHDLENRVPDNAIIFPEDNYSDDVANDAFVTGSKPDELLIGEGVPCEIIPDNAILDYGAHSSKDIDHPQKFVDEDVTAAGQSLASKDGQEENCFGNSGEMKVELNGKENHEKDIPDSLQIDNTLENNSFIGVTKSESSEKDDWYNLDQPINQSKLPASELPNVFPEELHNSTRLIHDIDTDSLDMGENEEFDPTKSWGEPMALPMPTTKEFGSNVQKAGAAASKSKKKKVPTATLR